MSGLPCNSGLRSSGGHYWSFRLRLGAAVLDRSSCSARRRRNERFGARLEAAAATATAALAVFVVVVTLVPAPVVVVVVGGVRRRELRFAHGRRCRVPRLDPVRGGAGR